MAACPILLDPDSYQLVVILNKWNINAQINHKSNFNHFALYISNLNIETIN